MKLNNFVYPYPVLSSETDDYINSTFNCDYSILEDYQGNKAISVIYQLDNKELEQMLEKKLIKVILHLECSFTSYREIIEFSGKTLYVKMDSSKFEGRLELNTLIISNVEIDIYSNNNFNPLYYGSSFSVSDLKKGSILGLTSTISVDLETKANDDDSVSSIIQITKKKSAEFMEVDLYNNSILICLPEKQMNQYIDSRNTLMETSVLSFVVLPALVYALQHMQNNYDESLTYRWYLVMEEKLEDMGYRVEELESSPKSILEIAQEILRNPLERSFIDIGKIGVSDE